MFGFVPGLTFTVNFLDLCFWNFLCKAIWDLQIDTDPSSWARQCYCCGYNTVLKWINVIPKGKPDNSPLWTQTSEGTDTSTSDYSYLEGPNSLNVLQTNRCCTLMEFFHVASAERPPQQSPGDRYHMSFIPESVLLWKRDGINFLPSQQ